jgi:hypothetical protein
MPEQLSAADLALIEEAAKKSSLVWLTPAGASATTAPPQAVWHVWHDGAVTLVAGGDEQPLPAFATPGKVVEVGLRSKDNGGLLATWLSQVHAPTPGTPEWDAAAAALHAERLNLPEGDRYLDRWTTTSIVLRLRPIGALIPPDGGSGAARPVPTPAVTLGMQPIMVRGVSKKAKKGSKPKPKAKKAR